MSKVVRERLQQTIQCMEEATQVIEKKCSNVQQDKAPEKQLLTEFLTEVQDLAIAFGTRIEQLRGIGTQTVTELESYCECLFHVSECMDSLQLSDAIKELIRQMEQIKAAFEQDFPDKKEMVFLPYKASMWDSLESVWKAADADPECDAYVIPIPYYDKNPDGTLGAVHYEGDMYPDYVPITDYKTYDIEKRKPDVIFIHNPYDECNYVTSVEPRYYSKKLTNYTNCLVYIPYFAIDENRKLDQIEHYVLTSAVINADVVVVQSDKVKEKYIEILNKFYRENGREVPDFSNKILGIGSPKFDAVNRKKPKLEDIPKEWRKIIGDGNKKIVFYNTHLSLLMPVYSKIFLRKLQEVLSYFKQREDVILLWRPHPLTIQTIKSMNPEVLELYLDIVNRYKDEKWGIYDDTADMERSIALSDAYYGSESSVTVVYRQTGKPVLLHNEKIPTEVV